MKRFGTKRKLMCGASALLAAATAASPVFAQDAQPARSANQDSSGGNVALDTDIVVTARKRAETELNVPSSITAIRQDQLLERGATTLADIASYVPGLNTGSGFGGSTVIIRGINTGADAAATSGIVVDGAPIGSSSGFGLAGSSQLDIDPSDIQRVEVLRGPQGTYYGASTLGGLVSYVTRQASLDRIEVGASGEISSTRSGEPSFTGRGSVSVPLVKDVLGIRASGFFERRGGFIDDRLTGRNDVNRADRYGGKIELNFRPTDRLSINIWGAIQKLDRESEDFIVTDARGVPTTGDLQYDQYLLPSRRQNFKILYGSADYDVGFARLTYIGTYQTSRVVNFGNGSSAALLNTLVTIGKLGLGPVFPTPQVGDAIYTVNLNQTTHELRLASSSDGPFTWLIGGFYDHETIRQNSNVQGRTTSGALVPGLDQAVAFNLNSSLDDYAAFGNVSYAIGSRLTVTGGVRVGRNSQLFQQFSYGGSLPGLNALLTAIYGPQAIFQAATVPTRSHETIATYLADAKYQFSPNAQAYIRFATGFRPGGPNSQSLGTPTTYRSDTVKSYEAGFKAQTADRKASIELSAYYLDWTDIQVAGSSGGISFRTNGGKASVRGVEMTGTVRPIAGLSFGAVFAYTDAHLDEAVAAVGGKIGDPLPNTPKITATVTADYEFPLSGSLRGVVGGVIRTASDRTISFDANPGYPNIRLDGYASGDIRAGIKTDRFEVSAFVRNVTDERAELGGRSNYGINEVVIARPRTFGLFASVKY